MSDPTGLMQVAPNGTEVGVLPLPCKEGDGYDYVIQLSSKPEGVEPTVTEFGIARDTLATLLVVMMKLPGGLRIPGMATVRLMPQTEDANLDSGNLEPPAT